MNHRVTVGTHRSKVGNWIDFVLASDRCQRSQVMDVDETLASFSVHRLKAHFTDRAVGAMVSDAGRSGGGAPLVDVHGDRRSCPLREGPQCRCNLWVQRRRLKASGVCTDGAPMPRQSGPSLRLRQGDEDVDRSEVSVAAHLVCSSEHALLATPEGAEHAFVSPRAGLRRGQALENNSWCGASVHAILHGYATLLRLPRRDRVRKVEAVDPRITFARVTGSDPGAAVWYRRHPVRVIDASTDASRTSRTSWIGRGRRRASWPCGLARLVR